VVTAGDAAVEVLNQEIDYFRLVVALRGSAVPAQNQHKVTNRSNPARV